jgi:hypothetical protein
MWDNITEIAITHEPIRINPSTPELNPSAQRCLPRHLLEILIFKWLTARLYKLFGVKGLNMTSMCILSSLSVMINACLPQALIWSNEIHYRV